MTLKKVHDKQPEKFEFTKENLELAKNILEKYPKNQKKVQLCLYYILRKTKIITGYRLRL